MLEKRLATLFVMVFFLSVFLLHLRARDVVNTPHNFVFIFDITPQGVQVLPICVPRDTFWDEGLEVLEVLRHREYGNPRSLLHFLLVNRCRIPSPHTFSALNKIIARHFLCGKQEELSLTLF
jgi:hypothetical protein